MRYLARSRASVSKPVYTGSWSFASFHDATPDISHLLLVSPRRYEALWFRDFPFFSLLSLSFFFYVGPTPLRIRQTTSFFPARKRSRERASKSREEAETFGSVWLGLFATDLDCFEEDQRGCSELAASRLISRFCFFVFFFSSYRGNFFLGSMKTWNGNGFPFCFIFVWNFEKFHSRRNRSYRCLRILNDSCLFIVQVSKFFLRYKVYAIIYNFIYNYAIRNFKIYIVEQYQSSKLEYFHDSLQFILILINSKLILIWEFNIWGEFLMFKLILIIFLSSSLFC